MKSRILRRRRSESVCPAPPLIRSSVTCLVVLLTAGGGIWWGFIRDPGIQVDRILAAIDPDAESCGLTIGYPHDQTIFPPDISAPLVQWEETRPDANLWLVSIEFSNGAPRMSSPCQGPQWEPTEDQWEAIKRATSEQPATLRVVGVNRRRQGRIVSSDTVSFVTSRDEVGAPIFYREVALPFREAVLNTAKHIRWRFGPVSSRQIPPVVLDKLPVCGNCHSFSSDGQTLAMEVDSGNDKASFTVAQVQPEIPLEDSNLITWADYRKEDGQLTFGLLCQVSPDGHHVVGTVKDRAMAVYKDDLMFSQLFFIVKGYLAIYDRDRRQYSALPGADDPQYVQTNAVWRPDGQEIVFARSRDPALDPPELRDIPTVLVPPQAASDFLSRGKTFLYDLYRIPFNEGRGGQAVPVLGASNNGMSNYFPKFSPDGKWMVFCRARSFMLLQPDSELCIIPAEGGEVRRLQCNTPRMNSWHSWSPNSKWLVFSSKANSPYTQLFLTHIDQQGNASPPVLLRHFTSPERAANIPEFVNASPQAIVKIREKFLDEQAYLEIGGGAAFYGNYNLAIHWFEKALERNPRSAAAYENWGAALVRQDRPTEALKQLTKALELDPDRAAAHVEAARALHTLGMIPEAMGHCREAIRLTPASASPHLLLGSLLIDNGCMEEGKAEIAEAVRLEPTFTEAHAFLGNFLCRQGDTAGAIRSFRRAIECNHRYVPALLQLANLLAEDGSRSPDQRQEAVNLAQRACEATQQKDAESLLVLASVYAAVGQTDEAISAAQLALQLARDADNTELIRSAQRRLVQLGRPG